MCRTCNSNAPCYPIWKILNEEYQQDWCSTCSRDVACRISGWPILNATAACNISPNAWLFGNGGCCINGSEPSNLASWIETICNNTWRTQFDFYDGMAQQDWEQYELPWNWTVEPDIMPQPTCTNKELYLGLFAIENTVFVIFVFFYGAITLWIIRGKELGNPVVLFILMILAPFRWLKKGVKGLFTFLCCLGKTDDGSGAVTNTILMAIVFAGIQLGFNFATAYVIKYTPGYGDIPAPLLALLFCCRPRLGWLACLLSQTPDRWLTRYFHLSSPGSLLRGQIAVARVAVSSAMSEVIMQLLGSYSLGKTAHIGVNRGFYLNNNLTPFWRGMQTRIMYVGALFWLVAGFGVIVMWIIVVIWHAAIMNFFTTTKSWMKHLAATTIPIDRQPPMMRNWRMREQPTRRPRQVRNPSSDELNIHNEEEYNIRGGAGTPGTYGSDQLPPGYQNIRRGDGGQNGASSSSAFDALPVRPQDFPQTTVSSSSQDSRPRAQRNGYQPFDANPEMAQMRPPDFPSSPGPGYEDNFRLRSPPATADARGDPGYIHRANPPLNAFPDIAYNGVQNGDHEDEEERRARSPPYDPVTHVPTNFREWQPYILSLGIFLGFISYIAQWLFWAGFVNAAGERSVLSNAHL